VLVVAKAWVGSPERSVRSADNGVRTANLVALPVVAVVAFGVWGGCKSVRVKGLGF